MGSVFALAVALPIVAFPEPLTLNEAKTDIRVDGHLSDWPEARMLVLDRESQVVQGEMLWKTPDDFSGRVFLTYDSQFLYLGAIVLKPSAVVNENDKSTLWNGDCIELFLSADPSFRQSRRLAKGDFHLGFSPGKDCQNPQMYCFNHNTEVTGGRVVARKVQKGYVLEACVPLAFFSGLAVGKGKTVGLEVALDQGGILGGDRVVQLLYGGDIASRKSPSAWTAFQWAGETEVLVPESQAGDFSAGSLQDGTQGATYLGKKNLKGIVMDFNGKPLPQARVTTWPKTREAVADEEGRFSLEGAKIYDRTVVYACLDGYASSLCPVIGEKIKNSGVTIRLRPLPFGDKQKDSVGPYFSGQAVRLTSTSGAASLFSTVEAAAKELRLDVIKLSGTRCLAADQADWKDVFDRFVALARAVGAEPLVEVPVRPMDAALARDWVKYCNVEKKYDIRFWAIGNEPDLPAEDGTGPVSKDYDVYAYINEFRALNNAMKLADPSLFILGPELAIKYQEGENDWITPFLLHAGDIVNLVSVHRYAALKAEKCDAKTVSDSMRREPTVLEALKSKVYRTSDLVIPLAVTGGAVCPQALTFAQKEQTVPASFWEALWTAEESGRFLDGRIGMCILSSLAGSGGSDMLSGASPKPSYWAQQMFSARMKGKAVAAVSRLENLTVYATQNPETKDVNLFFVSQMDRYRRVKIRLNNRDADIMADAGLDQLFDFEVPSYSIACLEIKADRSEGRATLYTSKMALAAEEPRVSSVRPR